MAKYLDLFTNEEALADPSVTVSEANVLATDVFIDLSLRERGINPADVALPNAVLTEIAVNWAKRLACVDSSITDDSVLMDKAKQFESTAKTLVKLLNREALGIAEPTGAAFGQVSLGRA